MHTAGVFDAGVIGALTPDGLARVFAPKVDAVRHLDDLTRGLDLDAFIVYSSASSVFMGAGSGGYAAANAFLDGLMAARRAAGLPGLSLAWGPWEQTTGMADTIDDLTRTRMSRREGRGGVRALGSAEGMELFRRRCGVRAGAAGAGEAGPARAYGPTRRPVPGCRTCCGASSGRGGSRHRQEAPATSTAGCPTGSRGSPPRSSRLCCSTWSVPRPRPCSGTPGRRASGRRRRSRRPGSTR